MKEMHSNDEDCRQLGIKLKKALGDKVVMKHGYGVIDGEYHSFPCLMYETIEAHIQDQLRFYCKFCRDEFLEIVIEDSRSIASDGHKLAALSDFYEVLFDEFGEPTVFYTLKDAVNRGFHFRWAFTHKKETIEEFMHGFPFFDAEVDQAIVIGESNQINEQTRNLFSHQMGLPIELLPLINENIEDYMKYKKSNEEEISLPAKVYEMRKLGLNS